MKNIEFIKYCDHKKS